MLGPPKAFPNLSCSLRIVAPDVCCVATGYCLFEIVGNNEVVEFGPWRAGMCRQTHRRVAVGAVGAGAGRGCMIETLKKNPSVLSCFPKCIFILR